MRRGRPAIRQWPSGSLVEPQTLVCLPANRSALLPGLRRSEIGVLVRHPIDKLANRRVSQQAFHIHSMALQFGIGEVRDQGLLTDRVHRHHIAPAPAFWNRMMPDDGFAGRTAAEPTRHYRCGSLILTVQIIMVMLGMLAGHF